MNACKSCKWWVLANESWQDQEMIRPLDSDFNQIVTDYEVRKCSCPNILVLERPLASNQACICDASGYKATIYTAQDFGCVLYEEGKE